MTKTPPTADQISQNGSGPAAEPPPNPFADLSQFRIDSLGDVEVEKVLTTVPVRKPKRTEFFRVHPGSDFMLDVAMLERSEGMDRETYLVVPAVRHPGRTARTSTEFAGIFQTPAIAAPSPLIGRQTILIFDGTIARTC